MSIYTHAERTVKKYTVADAIAAAKARTAGSVCLDSVKDRADDEAITLEQLNDIADAICDDTNAWG